MADIMVEWMDVVEWDRVAANFAPTKLEPFPFLRPTSQHFFFFYREGGSDLSRSACVVWSGTASCEQDGYGDVSGNARKKRATIP